MNPRTRPRRRRALAALLVCLTAACTTPREHRANIEHINEEWRTELPEDSLEHLLTDIDELGSESPDDPSALASVPLLCRQVLENPAAIVRAQSLRSAWKITAPVPTEPIVPDDVPAAEFSDKALTFEELELDPERDEGPEIQALAEFLGGYRFPPEQTGLAVDLADMVVSRGLWRKPGPVRDIFAQHMSQSARYALTLVTVEASADSFDFVREEALRSARHMDPGIGLPMIAQSFAGELDSQVVLAALGSLAALAPLANPEDVEQLLSMVDVRQDIVLRQRADRIREELDLRVVARAHAETSP